MFDLPVSTSTATFSPGLVARISTAPMPFISIKNFVSDFLNQPHAQSSGRLVQPDGIDKTWVAG